ncbi:MAG TPA: T9SS type A sorting domain-containing protein [Mucilaginibacter sp.]|nr:T9SS type A sorting domain-containing protein [Mucilaginibacter sp.]
MEKTFTLSRLIIKAVIIPLLFVLSTAAAFAQTTRNWIGTTNSWTTASNWSPAGVPAANDPVQIGVTVTFTNQPKIASGQTGSAGSITFGTKKASPALTISGTLTVNGNITMNSTSTITMDAATACILNLAGSINGGGTFNPSTFANAKLVMNGICAQYFPNTTTLGGNIGVMDIQNTYNGSTADRGVSLNTSVTINHTIVEDNAIFNANGVLVAGTNYYATIGANADYISKSTFNFRANDVIDPTATLEFTATNQTINLYKTNAGSTNIPPNVLFTGTNITVNAGTSPNNATVFKVLGNLTVQNTTNVVTFDPGLTLIDIDGNFSGSGALSSGSLPINIGGSWLNTATYNVGGNVTYDGNSAAASAQIVATSVNYLKDVIFTGASPKKVSAGTLNEGGNIDNSAGTSVDFISNSSTVLMNGSGTQYIKGGTAVNNTFPNNVVNGTIFNNITVATTGASPQVIMQGNNNIGPLGVLTMSTTPCTLNATSSNSLTLLSDATGSAAVAAIPLGASITGTINVQRFVKGSYPTDLSKRGYRLISSPVYTGTVGTAKVFDLSYLLSGAIITGPPGGGFFSVGNPSTYIYREDILPSDANFTTGNYKGVASLNNSPIYNIGTQKRATLTNIADTMVNLTVGNGVLFFFRGNKVNNASTGGTKTSLPYNYPEDVTFTDSGPLNTGTVNVQLWFRSNNNLSYTNNSLANAAVRGYCLIGNPYASAINWEKYNRNSTITNSSIYGGGGLSSTIYMFNPTNKQYEAYMQKAGAITTADTTTNIDPGTAVGSASNMIASGQGFFVRATTATQTLSFRETAKTNTQPTALKLNKLMGMPKESAVAQEPLLRLQLSKDSISTDEIVVRLNDKANAAYSNTEDAEDMGGISAEVSLSALSTDGVKLAITSVPLPKKSPQIVALFTDATAAGSYKLKLTQVSNLPAIYDVWLKDNFKHDSLSISTTPVYGFTIDKTKPTTFGDSRFQLIIRQNPQMALKLLSFDADKTSTGSLISWKVKNEFNYTAFYVERSIDKGETFESIGSLQSNSSGRYTFLDKKPATGQNQYRLKLYDINNNYSYSNIVTLSYSRLANIPYNARISVYPNPAVSTINLSIEQKSKIAAYSIKILNAAGIVVKESVSDKPSWGANIGYLKPGTYIVQVLNDNDKSIVGITSFVKN